MRLRNLSRANINRAAEPKPEPSSEPVSAYKWVVIEPAIFPGEQIVCVMDPAYLDESRAENSGLVHYLLPEIDLLGPIRDQRDRLLDIHRVKKHLGGWVREIDGRRMDSLKSSFTTGASGR